MLYNFTTTRAVLKFLLYLSTFITVYYFLALFILPFFTHPRFGPIEDYQRLSNWDNDSHATGDFDQDGHTDLIWFLGCAFLSSAQPSQIPQGQQCLASNNTSLIFPNQPKRIGQKFRDTPVNDFITEAAYIGIGHSYVIKYYGQPWKIIYSPHNPLHLKALEIQANGLLRKISPSFFDYINELLYEPTSYFVLYVFPLRPIFWITLPLVRTHFFNLNLDYRLEEFIGGLYLTAFTLLLLLLYRRHTFQNKSPTSSSLPAE